jgi:hypothetical protein
MLMAGQTEAQAPASGKSPTVSSRNLAPEEIIRQFTQKETEFYEAWMQYMYTQTAVIRLLSVDGRPTKETLRIVKEVVFNDDGTREVKRIRTSGKLTTVEYSPEDDEIMENLTPFALTTKELPLYKLKYLGKEKADELDCYVFSVKPKSTKGGKFYFDGKVWVDDQDLQIVKTAGKPVPQTWRQKFPEFETIRQMIDGKYWFPVWTHADDKLYFPDKVVRIEQTITYEDYRKFSTKATILPGSSLPDDD